MMEKCIPKQVPNEVGNNHRIKLFADDILFLSIEKGGYQVVF